MTSRPPTPGPSRRTVLTGTTAAAVALTTALPAAATAAGTGELELTEGTTFSARLSPDGRHIAMDLLGVLWVVSAAGGTARRLTGDLYDVAEPDWSPDGTRLVFQSYRDGFFHLWAVRPDGSGLEQLTSGPFDDREPAWSPDGTRVAFSSDRTGSYALHLLEVTTGRTRTLVDGPGQEYEPAWSADGRRLAFVTDDQRVDTVAADGTGRATAVEARDGRTLHQPSWSPGGTLVYHVTHDAGCHLEAGGERVTGRDEDVGPFRVSWLDGNRFVYTADGRIRTRTLTGGRRGTIGFTAAVTTVRPSYRRRRRDFETTVPQPVRGIGSPQLSPDGSRVAFRALNDLYLMPIGGRPEPLTRNRWWKSHPTFSPDGRRLAYAGDRGGTTNLWVRDLDTGAEEQLTHFADRSATAPAWSPDGRRLAFLDHQGALWTLEVADRAVRRVFPATFEPGRPTWSPDGRVIALAAVKPATKRFREGTSQILLVDAATGRARYVEAVPGKSIQTRGDDGPAWSPDGKRMAFVVESVLYVRDVAPDGTPTGVPRRLTDEVTDAPSWSGDGTRLLYLSGGRLRMVSAAGGAPTTVPVPLTWTNITPPARTVVHAGRLWDGLRNTYREDVDVVIERHRITAVEPHDGGRDGTLVDARDHVVMPGLIDMHNHREMQGYDYGDRQGRLWLAYGITTTRSPGDPAYHMVEAREAAQSGARIAPRFFATGEAVDGSRIYYNFMRPTYGEDQLQLEVERARALGYDLLKCYVRLPADRHRQLVEAGHAMGVPVTSHYHYPAAAFGADGTEHTRATSRFGYRRNASVQYAGYDDVIKVFIASAMARTPTLFTSSTLLREEGSLVRDERTRTLSPPWLLDLLEEQARAARTTDQSGVRKRLRNAVAQNLDIFRGGGRIVMGTDAPLAHVAVSAHLNLRAMVRYGFTPYEALLTATSRAGEALGEPLGRIEPGALADLVVVDGDVLTDIGAAAAVQRVVASGRTYTVGELMAPYRREDRPRDGHRVLPAVPEHPDNRGMWWHDPVYVEHARYACCTD